MINQRIFSANVGDSSVGIAGPDAIEQDIDNLLANDQELLGQINSLDAKVDANNDANHYLNFVLSSAQAIPNDTVTQIQFADKSNDFYTSSGGVIQVLNDGVYLIVVRVNFTSNSTGLREVNISGARQTINAVTGSNTYMIVPLIFSRTAGQTITITVRQTSGGALNIISGATQAYIVKLK